MWLLVEVVALSLGSSVVIPAVGFRRALVALDEQTTAFLRLPEAQFRVAVITTQRVVVEILSRDAVLESNVYRLAAAAEIIGFEGVLKHRQLHERVLDAMRLHLKCLTPVGARVCYFHPVLRGVDCGTWRVSSKARMSFMTWDLQN